MILFVGGACGKVSRRGSASPEKCPILRGKIAASVSVFANVPPIGIAPRLPARNRPRGSAAARGVIGFGKRPAVDFRGLRRKAFVDLARVTHLAGPLLGRKMIEVARKVQHGVLTIT